jgi:hypothetical protein
MERKVNQVLNDWKRSRGRLPLIVQGARQVGKTWSILDFGRRNFRNILYFNFESDRELTNIFERDLSPRRIIKELSVFAGESVFEDESLIFFDEIQACEKALTSLKYFAEEFPSYPIVCAGSLLGMAVNRGEFSFPVGKVSIVNMFPLDFEEFLWALDQKKGSEIIRDSFLNDMEFSLHQKFLDYYRQYLAIGGMPRVVQEYIDSADLMNVAGLQKNLNISFIADMAKYAETYKTVRVMAVYNSMPAQLAKENKKFQYKVIKSGARASAFGEAVEWLKASGIIVACHKISHGTFPAASFADPSSFKLYYSDTGLLCSMASMTLRRIINDTGEESTIRGALTENYVAVSLKTAGYEPYYWESEGKAEVDFVIQKDDQIIPVEVKAADNIRSKSLKQFISRYSPPVSYRISTKNFGFDNRIKSIPIYAVFCI